MQEPNTDDFNKQIQDCINEMQRILESVQTREASEAPHPVQIQSDKKIFNSLIQELLEVKNDSSEKQTLSFNRWTQRTARKKGPKATFLDIKKDSPKKRTREINLCDSPSDSPHAIVRWASPPKPTFAQWQTVRPEVVRNILDDLDAAEDPQENKAHKTHAPTDNKKTSDDWFAHEEEDREIVNEPDPEEGCDISKKRSASEIIPDHQAQNLESKSEKYLRGNSPSPNPKKSPRVSPRSRSGSEYSEAQSSQSLSANGIAKHYSVSLGISSPLFNSPILAASPSQKEAPAFQNTQILPSQLEVEPEIKAFNNPLFEILTAFNNRYKSIIEEERQQISQLLKHCQALIPQKINLDENETSLSKWMTEDLLDLLSLSCLRQIYAHILTTKSSLEKLQDDLISTNLEINEDQQLLSIYTKLNMSIRIAIDEDHVTLITIKSSHDKYQQRTNFLTQYFVNTKDETEVINVLYTLVENSTSIDKSYLEKNPTLVRQLVESAAEFLNNIPDSSTRMDFITTIIPNLKNYLVSLTREYDVEKSEMQQPVQCVF